MAWADAGMGAPIGGGLAEDAEERQRVAAVKQAFEQRAAGLDSEWRSADDSGPTAIGTIGGGKAQRKNDMWLARYRL